MILLLASTNRGHRITPRPLHFSTPLKATLFHGSFPRSNNNIRNHNQSAQSQETYRLLLHHFFCDFKLLKVCFVFKFINTPALPHYYHIMQINSCSYESSCSLLDNYLCLCLSVYLPVCVSRDLNILSGIHIQIGNFNGLPNVLCCCSPVVQKIWLWRCERKKLSIQHYFWSVFKLFFLMMDLQCPSYSPSSHIFPI